MATAILFISLISVLGVFPAHGDQATPKCPANEYWDSCPEGAKNPFPPQVCSALWSRYDHNAPEFQTCDPQCRCVGDLKRNTKGVCVNNDECLARCGPKEVYLVNTSRCEQTCTESPAQGSCGISTGCFCEGGYVRSPNGDCVQECECPLQCKENEIFSKCSIICPPQTCESIYTSYNCDPKPECIPGCDCRDGYLRNGTGGPCIWSDLCGKTVGSCPKNEAWNDCGTACPKTCDNKDLQIKCTAECKQGCFCNEGLVRNKDWVCVKPSECPVKQCPKNEEWKDCGTACPKTCKHKDSEIICTAECRKGCFCKDDLVRNDDGKCVKPSECLMPWCPKDETWNDCGTACPKTCDNKDALIKCTAECKKGCFCNDGLVRNKDWVCVKPSECQWCPKNEVWKDCGTACPKTCKNKDLAINCIALCKKGCFCKDDLVRNDDGFCVKPSECPIPWCPKNETWNECGTACPKTCDNKDALIKCTAECKKGCFCNDGLVRNKDYICVKPSECPVKRCPKNEEWKDCGTACPKTCKNKDAQIKCTAECKKGCFCKDGWVRRDDGVCVNPNECPLASCPKNEIWDNCGTACPKTCKNKDQLILCIAECRKGCFCKDDLVRNDKGVCVKPCECPSNRCPKNEHWEDCGTACPKTCKNKDILIRCVDKCVEGCFCDEGLVRNDEGFCVPPKSCPPPQPVCGQPNEEYQSCGTACPDTCSNYKNKDRPCILVCVPGCFCKEGFVRRDDGKCVNPIFCPLITKEGCGGDMNAEVGCRDCNATCSFYKEPFRGPVCPPNVPCQYQCKCKRGLILDEETGACVVPERCSNINCRPDQVYDSCAWLCDPWDYCPEDDRPRAQCSPPFICHGGCSCPRGYKIDRKSGTCVPTRDCPHIVCTGKNQVYDTCPSPCRKERCPGKGDESTVCPFDYPCEPRCVCRKGYYRDAAGECVPLKQCPVSKCPKPNEYLDPCVSPCLAESCADKDNQPSACNTLLPVECKEQCVCRKGYFRNQNNDCVPYDKCPTCPANSKYVSCKPWCSVENCTQVDDPPVCIPEGVCIPGCLCDEGYLWDTEGRCVPKDQCPSRCPAGEVYESCGTTCPETCKNRGEPIICTDQCVAGCFCPKGQVRDDNGKCVDPKDCTNKCPVGEVYDSCGTACPETCKNKDEPIVCTAQCVAGCFCPKGKVRNDYGNCVEPEDCTKKCPAGEVYNSCGTACPETCTNRGQPIPCTKQCVAGCFCPKGRVRDENANCVDPKDCRCKVNETYSDCISSCAAPTCNNQGKVYNCPLETAENCKKGCVCAKGYVKNSKGRCILIRDCPAGCGGDPNAVPGCSNYCGNTCHDYQDKGVACPQYCLLGGCACKKGYVYDEKKKLCVDPSQCPKSNVDSTGPVLFP